MIGFGIAEILFSQIPDFDQIWWLSIVAAVMSFTYSSIGLALGIVQVAGSFHIYSSFNHTLVFGLPLACWLVKIAKKMFDK